MEPNPNKQWGVDFSHRYPRAETIKYGGFTARAMATGIDALLLAAIIVPLLTAIYGDDYVEPYSLLPGPWDFLLHYVFPPVAVLAFWIGCAATPGKMVIGLKIVDAETEESPSLGQLIGRLLAYYVSFWPFMLGFLWVIFDRKRRGWHDKLAGTVVIKSRRP